MPVDKKMQDVVNNMNLYFENIAKLSFTAGQAANALCSAMHSITTGLLSITEFNVVNQPTDINLENVLQKLEVWAKNSSAFKKRKRIVTKTNVPTKRGKDNGANN